MPNPVAEESHADLSLVQHKGVAGTHSYSADETDAFAEHFNTVLARDPDVQHLLPIESNGVDLLQKVHDGLLLAKFLNVACPGALDSRDLNRPTERKRLSLFQMNENHARVIKAAQAVGVKTTNIGPSELSNGQTNPVIVLGLVWQLVKMHLLTSINLRVHPELVCLFEKGEDMQRFFQLPPEQILLRWFNFHLRNAGYSKRIMNLSVDLRDGECYTLLLNQIDSQCTKSALSDSNLTKRAEAVLYNAQMLGVRCSIKPTEIVSGNPRLNLLFTAAIFDQCPGLSAK